MNMEIASIIFEICIVLERATTSGTGLLLDRDAGTIADVHSANIIAISVLSPGLSPV